ncbi:MAG: hypothetical protein WA919_16525 [Coleofasciculaceae cyanobacterium]
MAEEAKDKSESQEENQSEKVDNRLPYEPPKLRKHGKINNTTKSVIFAPDFDGFFSFTDIS